MAILIGKNDGIRRNERPSLYVIRRDRVVKSLSLGDGWTARFVTNVQDNGVFQIKATQNGIDSAATPTGEREIYLPSAYSNVVRDRRYCPI